MRGSFFLTIECWGRSEITQRLALAANAGEMWTFAWRISDQEIHDLRSELVAIQSHVMNLLPKLLRQLECGARWVYLTRIEVFGRKLCVEMSH